MANNSYPAVFHKENDSYWVEFPDLEGCFSSGQTIEEAYENAKEALGMYLEKDGDLYERVIKKPSSISIVLSKHKKEIVMLVEFDSLKYEKKYKNKAIKKTLSIPEWLNNIAVKENVNFSNVLQEALIEKLNIK